MASQLTVRDVLAGRAPQGASVTVKGWVRTRRDSKAGFSFVNVSDGSSFHPVQVVAANTLPNYSQEILKLTAGCALEAVGNIVPSPAKGQDGFAPDFFGRETFLTVSEQLNVEAYCLALSRVYTFGPTFRAENSNTSRHLAEFWMVEPEIAFADLSDNADLAEALLKFAFESLLAERQEDLAFFDERIEKGLVAKLQGIVESQ